MDAETRDEFRRIFEKQEETLLAVTRLTARMDSMDRAWDDRLLHCSAHQALLLGAPDGAQPGLVEEVRRLQRSEARRSQTFWLAWTAIIMVGIETGWSLIKRAVGQ